ncbi:MAG: hypothetical protein IPF60_09395 [Betaproteobacteria bacterium]|nr:hypothetical protein [Betaproteobacteria bacterium]
MLVGHTHRVSNLMVGRILVAEGLNAGASYSVVQMMVQGQDVEWAGAATQVAKNLGVAKRPGRASHRGRCQRPDRGAAQPGDRHQAIDIKRAPSRLFESAMGNLVADAMRLKYPGVDAAYTNSGGLRADLVCDPRPARVRRTARSPGARCSRCSRSATAR